MTINDPLKGTMPSIPCVTVKVNKEAQDIVEEALLWTCSHVSARCYPDLPETCFLDAEMDRPDNWDSVLEAFKVLEGYLRGTLIQKPEIDLYVVDLTDETHPDFGEIYTIDNGIIQVRFTYGGPRYHWSYRRLSDFYIARR